MSLCLQNWTKVIEIVTTMIVAAARAFAWFAFDVVKKTDFVEITNSSLRNSVARYLVDKVRGIPIGLKFQKYASNFLQIKQPVLYIQYVHGQRSSIPTVGGALYFFPEF